MEKIQVLCWSEGSEPFDVYADGIHGLLATTFNLVPDMEAEPVFLSEPAQGVPEDKLARTDVLVWFAGYRKISKGVCKRIVRYVREQGMGFLLLHSAHSAKPFLQLTGTSCRWSKYIEDGKPAQIRPAKEHPIVEGIQPFVIEETEYHAEPFDVPEPEDVVLLGSYHDGTVEIRDGMTWTFDKGRVFYFRPGHEDYPTFHLPEVQQILINAVRWLAKKV